MSIKEISIKDFNGLLLEHSSGSKLKVLLYGAHVVSWESPEGNELLMMSSKSFFEKGKPIRGGIPVVFPQFSDEGSLPKHGFVRTSVWKIEKTGTDSHGMAFATLSLSSNLETKSLWQNDFKLEYSIFLGETLKLDFSILNNSTKPFDFQMAFHTYFKVEDIKKVRVYGLKGTTYADYLQSRKEFVEESSDLIISSEIDRVYRNVKGEVEIREHAADRKILIKKNNMPDVVVWNPWKNKASKLSDFGDNEYLSMLCIETGIIYQRANLNGGSKWHGSTEYIPSCIS